MTPPQDHRLSESNIGQHNRILRSEPRSMHYQRMPCCKNSSQYLALDRSVLQEGKLPAMTAVQTGATDGWRC